MALKFADNWAQEVADVSTLPEFQNATVEIIQPGIQGTYDPVEDAYVGGVPETSHYLGQARVIGVRWGTNNPNATQNNPTTISAVRVQLPFNAVSRVDRGWKVFVREADRNPALTNRVLTVTSDLQGAAAAARTLECSVDMDGIASTEQGGGID